MFCVVCVDMSVAMADAYHPKQVEAAWDLWWEAEGYYKPNVEKVPTPMIHTYTYTYDTLTLQLTEGQVRHGDAST